MTVTFLTVAERAAYGRYASGSPDQETLERFFFLDDADRALVALHRGEHNRLGFALLLVGLRHLGLFPADVLATPRVVIDYVAGQVGVSDPSCLKRYGEREKTRLEHQWEISECYGYTSFAAADAELAEWLDARAWTGGEGPKALFFAAISWLRVRHVLLPGLTTLTERVAVAREATEQRLFDTLAGAITAEQARALESVLAVPEGKRRSQLDLWRHAERSTSGKGMVAALNRVAEIAGLGLGEADIAGVPARRVIELARYGMAAKAPKLARHPYHRRIATLLATVRWLHTTAVDDALELFDVFMSNELISNASKQAERQRLRQQSTYARHAGVLKTAAQVLDEAETWGDNIPVQRVWEAIETAVGSRARVRAAIEAVAEIEPPAWAEQDGQWREQLVQRFATIRGFVKLLCPVIAFGATAEAAPVLAAMQALPDLLERKPTRRIPAGYLDAALLDVALVPQGWWHHLVFPTSRPAGTVDRSAYVFCVLEQFHRGLKKRDLFALDSDRWADPRARLLDGPRWDQAKPAALAALQLPEDPDELLAGHAEQLDAAWRATASGMVANPELTVDEQGRLHLGKDAALDEPASLVDLRNRMEAMLPQVDLPELILEVMAWHPEFAEAFTAVSGATTRLADLPTSVAALLTAHALNVGLGPVAADTPALRRDRLTHVDQHYLRPENYAAANAVLVNAQADIPLAQAWGGGLVAAADGMRFVVPVRSADARPNPKYFGRRRGATWLNAISDQQVGLSGRVVSGTPKDTLHMVDLIYNPDGGARPEVLITDEGSYSDIVFGILSLLGFDYRPALADLPDQKLWRITRTADYGPLDSAARGRIELDKIRRHWPDICRVIASIHTREISAYDVIRILQHGGRPTALGEAVAHYGRIFKTRHVLSFVDDPDYRRTLKRMRNLNEGRHDLARHVFHGRKGELHRAYHAGMEDQLGVLGLVLNCITLWNTFYLNAALEQLHAEGYPVREADKARLWAYQRKHIEVHGHYSFYLPELGGQRRALREPDQPHPERT